MKKFIVLLLIVTISLGSVSVYADSPSKWAEKVIKQKITEKKIPVALQSGYQSVAAISDFSELVNAIANTTPLDCYNCQLAVAQQYLPTVKIFGAKAEDAKVKLTRAQAATMLANFMRKTNRAKDIGLEKLPKVFTDTIPADVEKDIAVCYNLKVMSGSGGKFNASGYITREQLIMAWFRALEAEPQIN